MTGSKSSSSKTKYIDSIFMPSSRCVVQDCGNRADADAGISLHLSPSNSRQRALLVRFVRTHRANFKPSGTFPVCSEHFSPDCFERSVHFKGQRRTLKLGSIPIVWKKVSSPVSKRRRRTVSSAWRECRHLVICLDGCKCQEDKTL